MTESRRAAAGGFTLLEVLVAVALLGIVVSVLARSAIEGMSYEGDATRRTRASLLADRALFGIEAGLKLAPPKALHEESEVGEFQINLDVQPLELGPAGLDALAPAREPPSGTGRAKKAKPAQAPAAEPSLFRIVVRVAWLEGLQELEVTRSSFAYDASAVTKALAEGKEQPNGQDDGKGRGKGPTPPPSPPAEEEP